MVLKRTSADLGESDGAAGADPSDPAGVEGVAAQGGTDGTGQVEAAFGPVQARADGRTPCGGR